MRDWAVIEMSTKFSWIWIECDGQCHYCMEYIKTFHMICYLVLNGGEAMHAWYGCVCQWQRQIRRRFGAAESDILADRHIRIMCAWPHHHLIPNNKSFEKPWRIPCRDHWGMNFMTVISKLHCHIWQCWICSFNWQNVNAQNISQGSSHIFWQMDTQN